MGFIQDDIRNALPASGSRRAQSPLGVQLRASRDAI
jgi:hypothetical protein